MWFNVFLTAVLLLAVYLVYSKLGDQLASAKCYVVRKVQEAIPTLLSQELVKQVCNSIPVSLEYHEAQELDKLRREIKQLREASKWIMVPVMLVGLNKEGEPYYAPVWLHRENKIVQAVPEKSRVFGTHSNVRTYAGSEIDPTGNAMNNCMGSPHWTRTEDPKVIILLGQAYHRE